MGQHTKWIDHKGRKILFNDFKGLPTDEFAKETEDTTQILLNQPSKRPLVLTDVTGTFTNDKITQKGKEMSQTLDAKDIHPIVALAGISGAKRVLANVVMKNIYFAKSVEDAKDWLVEEEKKYL